MRRLTKGLIAAALLAAAGITVNGSSHREALAILNEPCADNTDTYAWVSNGLHDKLYLIMDFYPLHEPGQGNQGVAAPIREAGIAGDHGAAPGWPRGWSGRRRGPRGGSEGGRRR